MKTKLLLSTSVFLFFTFFGNPLAQSKKFNLDKDLLLVHFDCKTDVDDVQTMAGLSTLLKNKTYQNLSYHAVTGTYGVQEGLYVPPNTLLERAFIGHWSDAHTDIDKAVKEVLQKVKITLLQNGDVWIADAGQSDFSAKLIAAVKTEIKNINSKVRFHVVQHSDWNESVTAEKALNYVKTHTDYNKIPDGNALNNGTPGFRDPNYKELKKQVKDAELLDIWDHAIAISNQYNGKDDRYLNEAIAAGGLDFSDLSEVCWILDIQDINNIQDFFYRMLN